MRGEEKKGTGRSKEEESTKEGDEGKKKKRDSRE